MDLNSPSLEDALKKEDDWSNTKEIIQKREEMVLLLN